VENHDQNLSHLSETQYTESENHPDWKSHQTNSFKGNIGGDFFTQHRYMRGNIPRVSLKGSQDAGFGIDNYGTATYEGPMYPCPPNILEFPPASNSSYDRLAEMGATAIARISPSSPAADLSVLLGETLHDGIPAIIGSTLRKWRHAPAKQVRKDIGGEYLNYEFGWKPLVSDLKKVATVIRDKDAIWRQYVKDSQKSVRRGYQFPEESEFRIDQVYNQWPYISPSSNILANPDTNSWLLGGKLLREFKITRRQWFSGAFMYYVPPPEDGAAYSVIQSKKLLGLTLTPDTLWNLAPWSWAVDWFANTGDNLANWSNWAIDGQVLLYGYMMEHTVSSYSYTYTGPNSYVGGVPPTITTVTETKVRRKAGPYGFGTSWEGLSPRQLAITGALGISRGK
jgi:hypothetical protein